MDRSLGTTAEPRIQDVTPQILKNHVVYGASDYTAPHRYASGRALNYVSGGSISSPEVDRVSVTPYTLRYKDSVGLFGCENHFVKVDLQVDGTIVLACYEEEFWDCAIVKEQNDIQAYWDQVMIDALHNKPIEPDGFYQAAINRNSLPSLSNKRGFFSIELINNKTGNKYNDAWIDVRLYTKNRQEHPYNKMYVRPRDQFYIGFHARNTRRLPYDVECVIGANYVPIEQIEDERYIMQR